MHLALAAISGLAALAPDARSAQLAACEGYLERIGPGSAAAVRAPLRRALAPLLQPQCGPRAPAANAARHSAGPSPLAPELQAPSPHSPPPPHPKPPRPDPKKPLVRALQADPARVRRRRAQALQTPVPLWAHLDMQRAGGLGRPAGIASDKGLVARRSQPRSPVLGAPAERAGGEAGGESSAWARMTAARPAAAAAAGQPPPGVWYRGDAAEVAAAAAAAAASPEDDTFDMFDADDRALQPIRRNPQVSSVPTLRRSLDIHALVQAVEARHAPALTSFPAGGIRRCGS